MQNSSIEQAPSAQQCHALVVLVQEILAQIDEVASLLTRGVPARVSHVVLREMCSVLGELEPVLHDKYFEFLLVAGASRSPSSIAHYGDDFAEHSVHSKRQLLTKLRSELLAA